MPNLCTYGPRSLLGSSFDVLLPMSMILHGEDKVSYDAADHAKPSVIADMHGRYVFSGIIRLAARLCRMCEQSRDSFVRFQYHTSQGMYPTTDLVLKLSAPPRFCRIEVNHDVPPRPQWLVIRNSMQMSTSNTLTYGESVEGRFII